MMFATVELRCSVCSIEFCVGQAVSRDLHQTGRSFYCPNGHKLHFDPQPPEEVKELQERVEALRANWMTAREKVFACERREKRCLLCGAQGRGNAGPAWMRRHLVEAHGATPEPRIPEKRHLKAGARA